MKSRTAKRGEILCLDILTVDTREMKEKMEQYGTIISIRIRKSEYEKTQKQSLVCFSTEPEAKKVMTDIKYNCLQEGWDTEIYQRIKPTCTEPNIVRKGTDNNITEDPPRIEQNISNNKMRQ